MANNLNNKTIFIDTTMASSYLTTLGVTAKPLRVQSVKLIGGSAASTYSITDGSTAGNVLLSGAASTAVEATTAFPQVQHWRDFKATISGTGAVLEIVTA